VKKDRIDDVRALVFRALANDYRLKIAERLLEGEAQVSELCRAASGLPGTVSQHLRYFKEANLVACRVQGSARYYRLIHTDEVVALLEAARDASVELREQSRVLVLKGSRNG
jgi:DNA-binding transcriptional ArsR family regulator